ncbi:hypothetical protein CS8_091160 [Cupriavidus sp. 8B]
MDSVHRLDSPAMRALHRCHLGIHAAVSQIDDGRAGFRGARRLLQQNGGLIKLGMQGVAVVGIAPQGRT